MECFIEFSYKDESVFKRIYKLIEYIKIQKELGNLDCDDSTILNFYNEEELQYYWWPTEEESKEFWDKYYLLNEEEREILLNEQNWDLESVIDAIKNGEYIIKEIIDNKEGIGRLCFEPWSFPYGGVESLIELIKAFNIEIMLVEG